VIVEYKITSSDQIDCSGSIEHLNRQNMSCRADISDLDGNCTQANGFGYNDLKPCIYLKLNKASGKGIV
jgi:hypothetical protein